MEEHKRHKIVWTVCRPVAMGIVRVLFGYKAEVYREKGPYLVLSNHNAELDPMLVAYSFPEPLHFVASEHIMRQGRISDFLRWSTHIITRQKGGSASGTVRSILRDLRDGNNVCLFPEGNRSWDGVTAPLPPATGKLARMAGVKLITYRTEGIYFSNPRWSGGSIRRGSSRGHIVGIYEPEYLKTLSADAVQELIETDIHEDAYERQRRERTKFRGRHLAEHLETLLFVCPHCKAEGSMKSLGNRFFCLDCGYSCRYTEEGFFAGSDVVFDTVKDWSDWQEGIIADKCARAGSDPIFRDTDMLLYKIQSGESAEFVSAGELILYRDRLVLPDGTGIPMASLRGMSLMGPSKLHLSDGKTNYAVKSTKLRCTVKYLSACRRFDKGLQYGV